MTEINAQRLIKDLHQFRNFRPFKTRVGLPNAQGKQYFC